MKLAYQDLDWAPLIEPNGIQAVERQPAEIDEPRLQQLYDHWNEARGDSPWLLRADLRPESCPTTLPHLALVERRRSHKPSLYIRLTGEEITNPTFGFVKGAFVENLTPDWYRDHLVASYRRAFTDGEARFELVRVVHSYRVILYRRLTLPLSQFGRSVDQLLVATIRTRRLADFILAGRELS